MNPSKPEPTRGTLADHDAKLQRDGISPSLPAAEQRMTLGLRVLLYVLRGMRIGSLDLELPDGHKVSLQGSEPGPHGVLQIRSSRLVGRILSGGEVGFGEAYLDHLWDSPDLATLLAVLFVNEPYYRLYEKNWLSRAWGWLQHRRRAAAAGLADRVQFELCDYRDIQGQFDRIVSIEMYEAVGEEYWPAYFAAIHRALKPGGRAALQGITIHPRMFPEYRTKRDFIQKHIFPGGMLCPPGLFQDLAVQAGLAPEDPRFYARDYADTLAHWHRNVLAKRNEIIQQFDERFLRLWRYYLAYCECGFRTGSLDLMQLTLRRDA